MRLSDTTYEYIKGEVAYIYQQQNIRCFPIYAAELAVDMGYIIVPYSSLSAEAYREAIETSQDGFYAERNWHEYIFINDDSIIGEERRGMTILHEIGHAVLGHDDSILDDETKESEAAFFARYLAAPPSLVHLISPKNASSIQCNFSISIQASEIALEYYDKWKSVVLQRGLAYYDKIILELFGLSEPRQLDAYLQTVKEGTTYVA